MARKKNGGVDVHLWAEWYGERGFLPCNIPGPPCQITLGVHALLGKGVVERVQVGRCRWRYYLADCVPAVPPVEVPRPKPARRAKPRVVVARRPVYAHADGLFAGLAA